MMNIKNSTKFNKITAAIICAGLAISLSSCSAASPTLATQTAQGGTASALPSYVPSVGGQLTIAIPQGVQSYDPLLAEDEDLINMLSLVYETPLTVDASGKISPNLVETWKSDTTGTDFTFTVRKSVVFQNGNTLTAADLYQNIMDILALDGTFAKGTTAGGSSASPSNSSSSASKAPSSSEGPSAAPSGSVGTGFIASWTSGGETGTAGSSAPSGTSGSGGNGTASATPGVNRYTIYNSEIASVTQTDESTIDIKMKNPGRDALYFMTFPVRPKGDTDFTKPVGSGPYQVESMGSTIKLTVNPKWWKVAPFIENIEVKPIGPKDDKLADYQSGTLNFIATDNAASSKLKTAGKTQVVDYATNYYDCLIPNLFEDPLKNDQIRQAISYAINRRTLISTVLLNHAIATEMPISPNFFAFNTKYNMYQIDQDMAKEMLAKAGYRSDPAGQGTVLTLSVIVPQIIGQEYRVEAAKEIAEQLADVGINCTLEALTPQDYTARLNAGNFMLAYCSYYLDQNNDLSFMLDPDAAANFGHVSSPELTADIQACNAAITETDMTAAYDKLEQYFMDKVPQIGLYYRMHSIVTDEAVQGMNALFENHLFADVSAWSMAHK